MFPIQFMGTHISFIMITYGGNNISAPNDF